MQTLIQLILSVTFQGECRNSQQKNDSQPYPHPLRVNLNNITISYAKQYKKNHHIHHTVTQTPLTHPHSRPFPHHLYTPHSIQMNPSINSLQISWYPPLDNYSKIGVFIGISRFGTWCRNNPVGCLFIRNPRLTCTLRGLITRRFDIPASFRPQR